MVATTGFAASVVVSREKKSGTVGRGSPYRTRRGGNHRRDKEDLSSITAT